MVIRFGLLIRVLETVLVLFVAALITDGGWLIVLDYPVVIACAAVLGIAWMIRVVHTLAFYMKRNAPAPERRSWLRLVHEPVLAFFVLLCVYTSLPFRARVFASGPSLRSLAASAHTGAVQLPLAKPRWAGLFRVREVDIAGSAVRFITADCGLVDDCGLVYSPEGQPPIVGEDGYTHVGGPWWHWYRSW